MDNYDYNATQLENTPAPKDVAARLSATRHPFWGWVDCALVLGLFVGLIGLIFLMTAVATLIFPSLKTDQAPLLLSTQLAFYVAIYFAFLLVFRIRYDESVFFPLGWRRTVRSGTLLILGISGFLLSVAVNVMTSLTHTPNVRMEILNQLERQPIILGLFGLMVPADQSSWFHDQQCTTPVEPASQSGENKTVGRSRESIELIQTTLTDDEIWSRAKTEGLWFQKPE